MIEPSRENLSDVEVALRREIRNSDDLRYCNILMDIVNAIDDMLFEKRFSIVIKEFSCNQEWEFENMREAREFWNALVGREF